jgi:hypothetical protein
MEKVTIIFGKEQVDKIHQNQVLTEIEKDKYQKNYFFESKVEADAFVMGIQEAVGWQEVYCLN